MTDFFWVLDLSASALAGLSFLATSLGPEPLAPGGSSASSTGIGSEVRAFIFASSSYKSIPLLKIPSGSNGSTTDSLLTALGLSSLAKQFWSSSRGGPATKSSGATSGNVRSPSGSSIRFTLITLRSSFSIASRLPFKGATRYSCLHMKPGCT